VALIPSRLADAYRKQLTVIEPPIDVPGFDVMAVWHPRVHSDAANRWVRDRLIETAKR
jgi:DNA-binding transcriptional LysR family regulator